MKKIISGVVLAALLCCDSVLHANIVSIAQQMLADAKTAMAQKTAAGDFAAVEKLAMIKGLQASGASGAGALGKGHGNIMSQVNTMLGQLHGTLTAGGGKDKEVAIVATANGMGINEDFVGALIGSLEDAAKFLSRGDSAAKAKGTQLDGRVDHYKGEQKRYDTEFNVKLAGKLGMTPKQILDEDDAITAREKAAGH